MNLDLDEVLNAFEGLEDAIDPRRVEYSRNLKVFLNALLGVGEWKEGEDGEIVVGKEVYRYNNLMSRWVKFR